MLQLLGSPFANRRIKQGQMDSQIWILVDHIHEYLSHIQFDSKFLLALADERLLFCFTWLHLAAHKLPQQPLALWAGRWQIINLS